jgi:hypothetical protein
LVGSTIAALVYPDTTLIAVNNNTIDSQFMFIGPLGLG